MVHDLQIRAPYLKREEGAVAKKCSNVPTGFTLSVNIGSFNLLSNFVLRKISLKSNIIIYF